MHKSTPKIPVAWFSFYKCRITVWLVPHTANCCLYWHDTLVPDGDTNKAKRATLKLNQDSCSIVTVVWDECIQYEKDRLENIQIKDARTVSFITRFTNLHKLYYETGSLTLDIRRK